MSGQKVSGAGDQNFFEKLFDFLPTGKSSLENSNQQIGQSRATTALNFLIGQANDGTGASKFTANGQQATGNARQIAASNGFKSINLDDFLSVNKGSNSLASIVIGNAEGTRTAVGKFTRLYFGHTDPGDKKANIGSFSYNASRGNGHATTPSDADRVELQDLNSVKQSYENKVRAAGLDPNNALLAATFFDEHIQSPRSAQRFLSPENLSYIKEHGINAQTMAEARFRSWINPETGNLYRTAKGNFSAGGFAQIARDRLNVRNPTEAQVQQVVRQDQGRRIGELVRALKAQGLADGSTTNQTGTTNPTTPINQTNTQTPTTPSTGLLKRGATGAEVKDLQTALVRLGELTDAQMQTGVGIYGPKTQKAVAAFQQKVGLSATGEFDQPTRKALGDVLSAMERGNNAHPSLIKNAQDKLVELGFLKKDQIGGGAGVFGPKTEAALKAFQAQNGIPSTGRFGPLTYKALFGPNAESAKPVVTTPSAPVSNPNPTGASRPTVNRGFTEYSDGPGNHYDVNVSGVGRITVTEGFLVNGPHSAKNGIQAITGDGKLHRVPNGQTINLGIDYVVHDPQNRVKNWFGGEVVGVNRSSKGYGNQVIVKTDQTFKFNGKDYPVYTHYAHLNRIDVKENQHVNVGSVIGQMGNTGGSHGAHVDQRFWIQTPQGKIDVSPNLLVNRQ